MLFGGYLCFMEKNYTEKLAQIHKHSESVWVKEQLQWLMEQINEQQNLEKDVLFQKWKPQNGVLNLQKQTLEKRVQSITCFEDRSDKKLSDREIEQLQKDIDQEQRKLGDWNPIDSLAHMQKEQALLVLKTQEKRLKQYWELYQKGLSRQENNLLWIYLQEIKEQIKDFPKTAT